MDRQEKKQSSLNLVIISKCCNYVSTKSNQIFVIKSHVYLLLPLSFMFVVNLYPKMIIVNTIFVHKCVRHNTRDTAQPTLIHSVITNKWKSKMCPKPYNIMHRYYHKS